MPPWGRPSGAKGASRRRKQWDWGDQHARVEELDSDDTDIQGVGLVSGKETRFTSDPLHFTGTELAPTRVRKSYIIEDSAGSSDSEGSELEGIDASRGGFREEEAHVQSALKRIQRAQDKGRKEVKLNQDELDALENRRKRMQEAEEKKARKGSGSSNGSGSEKKRRSDRNIVIPLAPPGTASSSRSSSRPNSSRRSSRGKSKKHDEPPSTTNPPGFLVAGADGLQYSPLGSSQQPSSNRNSISSRPRAPMSSQAPRGAPNAYFSTSQRHVPDSMRPASSASNRSRAIPDEEGRVPNSRRSSGSSSYNIIDPFEYQVSSDAPPPVSAQYMTSQQSNRRVAPNPQNISYSSVRRSVVPAPRGQDAFVDPSLYPRRSNRDELAEEYYSSSGESSNDLGNGVQVFVEEREERERDRAVQVPRKPVGGGKKGRKR